jgi:hypothetical protein
MEGASTTTLVERWSETKGDLEFRAFQDGDQFVLVVRRIVDGRPVGYAYWHDHPTLQAAIDDVPNAVRYAS